MIKILLAIFLVSTANAAELLVNNPNSVVGQERLTVGETGSYGIPERVLWDTRKDGAMPKIILGAMKRVKNTLVVDIDMQAAMEKKMAEDATAAQALADKRVKDAEEKAALEKKIISGDVSVDDLRRYIILDRQISP